MKYPRRFLSSLSALGLLAGCGSLPPMTVETFRVPPAGWADIYGAAIQLNVRNAHLELAEDLALEDPTEFTNFKAMVDVAFVGGNPKGIAGLFVSIPDGDSRSFFCLAMRSGGEWRTYRSADPLEPVGGRMWQAPLREAPGGFFRLGARSTGGGVQFTLDGKAVEQYPIEGPSSLSGPDGPPRALQLGIFNRQAVSRWKNFIAGEEAPDQEFRPEDHEFWGQAADAQALEALASSAASSFKSKPTRMGIYAVVASLDEASRIHEKLGDAQGRASLGTLASRISSQMTEGARKIGDSDLHSRAFAFLRSGAKEDGGGTSEAKAALLAKARAAEKAGALGRALCFYLAAAEGGGDPSLDSRIRSLKSKLPPLRLDFQLSSTAEEPLFDVREFWQVTREIYGGLPRQEGGELEIAVRVNKSSNEVDEKDSERKVPVSSSGTDKLRDLLKERSTLEARLPNDLLDARARANVLRGSSSFAGPSALADLKEYRIQGKVHVLPMTDGDKIVRAYKRLDELGALISEEERKQEITYRTIKAKVRTFSIIVDASYSASLDGKQVLEVKNERTYLGIEQWSHAASKKLGIAAARFSDEEAREAAESVRERALRRFQTAISLDNFLAKLGEADRLSFLVRLLRSSGGDEIRDKLKWAVQSEVGLKGQRLEEIARRLED